MDYLSAQDVIFIHDSILADTVEDKNLSPDRPIESAINRVADHIYYTNLKDLYEIAALYGIAIAKGHCFNNGNKRTGMLSMVVFLGLNGARLIATDEEMEELMIDIVEDRIDQSQLARWLNIHIKE